MQYNLDDILILSRFTNDIYANYLIMASKKGILAFEWEISQAVRQHLSILLDNFHVQAEITSDIGKTGFWTTFPIKKHLSGVEGETLYPNERMTENWHNFNQSLTRRLEEKFTQMKFMVESALEMDTLELTASMELPKGTVDLILSCEK